MHEPNRERLSRRDFVKLASVGAAGLLAGGASGAIIASRRMALQFGNDLELNLRASSRQMQIKAGQPTHVSCYEATLVRGGVDSLETVTGSYLGPVIRAFRGQRVIIHFTNDLDEPTTIHWHGLSVPSDMDGGPQSPIEPGQTFTYEFVVNNRAGTYWFHPHPHMMTASQVMQGLAGLFIVQETIERMFGIPSGEYDMPLILQDRTFDADNQFAYTFGGEGFLGNTILVNGSLNAKQNVCAGAYRLRVLNGSNGRTFKLAWADGSPLTVFGTDGGLLSAPVRRDYVMLSPGERVDLWVDFSIWPLGSAVVLRSLSFSGVGLGGNPSFPNGAPFDLMQFNIASKGKRSSLRPRLLPIIRYRAADAVNAASPRTINITFNGASRMYLMNGRSFEMGVVADDEVFQLGHLYLVEFVNAATGGPVMAHPIHYHGTQFQVLERTIQPAKAATYETVRYGFVDTGWKDTVMVTSGERVRVLMKFTDHPGLFVYHCHILEHEDHGMMRHLRVDR